MYCVNAILIFLIHRSNEFVLAVMIPNPNERFGLVPVLLHWIMALADFTLFGLGCYIVDLNIEGVRS